MRYRELWIYMQSDLQFSTGNEMHKLSEQMQWIQRRDKMKTRHEGCCTGLKEERPREKMDPAVAQHWYFSLHISQSALRSISKQILTNLWVGLMGRKRMHQSAFSFFFSVVPLRKQLKILFRKPNKQNPFSKPVTFQNYETMMPLHYPSLSMHALERTVALRSL